MFGEIMGNSQVVSIQAVFGCLVDYDDNFSKNPAEVAVGLCINGPLLYHRGNFFLSKRLPCVAVGMLPIRPGFLFSTVSCRCFMAADSQSSVQLVLRVVGEGGGTRV